MEISLFEQDTPLTVERCVLYPYPDLRRIWTRLWLSAAQDETHPNLELIIYNPDGTENTSVFLMNHAERKVDTTLHLRRPQPGARYWVAVEMTQGAGVDLTKLERKEFEMTLAFRNPDKGEEGFGFGVDWEEVARKATGQGG